MALALAFLLQLKLGNDGDDCVRPRNRWALKGVLLPETFLVRSGDALLVNLVLLSNVVVELPYTSA